MKKAKKCSAAVNAVKTQNMMGFTYIVQPGDTLDGISTKYSVPIAMLQMCNSSIESLNDIYIGQTLNWPVISMGPSLTWPSNDYYTIQPSDGFVGISEKFGIALEKLMQHNNSINLASGLSAGQILFIPNLNATCSCNNTQNRVRRRRKSI